MLYVIMISCAHGQHKFSNLLIEIVIISIKDKIGVLGVCRILRV